MLDNPVLLVKLQNPGLFCWKHLMRVLTYLYDACSPTHVLYVYKYVRILINKDLLK